MNIREIAEWIDIGDDDFQVAKDLNSVFNPNNDKIYYHCSQSVEKYLKGFLAYNDINFDKNHDLPSLIQKCIIQDSIFNTVALNCATMNNIAEKLRYPHRKILSRNDVYYALDTAYKVKTLKPIQEIRIQIEERYGQDWQERLFNRCGKEQIILLKCVKYDNKNNEIVDLHGNKMDFKLIEVISENIYKLQYEKNDGGCLYVLQRISNNLNERWYFEENFGPKSAMNFIKQYDYELKKNGNP